MLTLRRTALASLALLFAAACGEAPTEFIDAPPPDITATADVTADANAATTKRETFEEPFPRPDFPLPYVPVPAPCLDLGEPLQMSGTWTGWIQSTETAAGRLHTTEYIDYSQITVELGDLTWLPGPGAHEILVFNVPAPGLELDEVSGAFNIKHQFNTRFLSQDGLPDLRVSHSQKVLVDGNGVLRHAEFVPFEAECIGNGR